jgi:hypothetical protein
MAEAVSRWPLTSEAVALPGQPYSDLRCTQCHSDSIIPPLLHTCLRLNTAVTRRTNGRSLGTVKREQCCFLLSRKHGAHKYRTFTWLSLHLAGWLAACPKTLAEYGERETWRAAAVAESFGYGVQLNGSGS